MKSLPIVIIILIASACSKNKEGEQISMVDSIQKSVITENETSREVNKFGKRTSFDSLHFSIIRKKHKNEKLYIEAITDKKSKIDSWKEYYENGLIKVRGRMTTSNHIYIGKWEYFSENGKLDHIEDYDAKQPIPYFKAINIASENGFEIPNMEVTKAYEDDKIYWKISRWKVLEDGVRKTAETILIDSESGKITIPEYQKIGVY